MAYIGLRKLNFWPISTPRVDGSAITYGSPVLLSPAVEANVSYDIANNPDHGDDVVIHNDKGINGYSIAMEMDDISPEGRVACLGWKELHDTATPPNVTGYRATDAMPPEGGLSYIRVKILKDGSRKYEAFFYHALQCSSGGENASTKRSPIEWNHATMNADGIGCYLDSSGEVAWFDMNVFGTEAAAVAYINGKAGYTPTTE